MRILAVIYIAIAGFILVPLLGYTASDPPEFLGYVQDSTIHNYLGLPGAVISAVLLNLFGFAAYALPAMLVVRAFSGSANDIVLRFFGVISILIGTAGLCVIAAGTFRFAPYTNFSLPCPVIGPGGYSGVILATLLIPHFQIAGASVFLISLTAAGIVLAAGDELEILFRLRTPQTEESKPAAAQPAVLQPAAEVPRTNESVKNKAAAVKTVSYQKPGRNMLIVSEPVDEDLSLDELHEQGQQLKKVLADFKIQAEVVDIHTGPVVSQFELKLALGTRIKKIQQLADDLGLAFRTQSVRVAQVPGKNTLGVELPNEKRQMVRIRDVMDLQPDVIEKYVLPIFLGKNVVGEPLTADLAKMPHLLIAGRTGTGKSVCLNSIIISLLMTRTPAETRFIMIDPKRIEMRAYRKIPHLLCPVVTDMKKAEEALAWAVMKMEERYQLFETAGVKQLSEYNSFSESALRRKMGMLDTADEEWAQIPKKMDSIVVVIDEMADLMAQYGREIEAHIARLAAKSRAAGIHLILATQKPTVDVITGLIKSNLPARIAFGVTSSKDSMVILDETGAETLLGCGDMLFLQPGTNTLVRGQGTFVSDDEIDKITALIETDTPDFVEELLEDDRSEGEGTADGNDVFDADGNRIERDELYSKAVELVISEGRGSITLVQNKLGVGYPKAARMIEFMEKDGILGPHRGAKPRDVLMSLSEWKRRGQRIGGRVSVAVCEEDDFVAV